MADLTPIQVIQGLEPIVFTDKVQSVPYVDDVNDLPATEVNAFRDRISGLIIGLKYILSLIQNSEGGEGVDYSIQIAAIQDSIASLKGGNTTATITSLENAVNQVQNLLDTGDLSLDTAQEWVDFMKSNKTLIESITTNKLNVSAFNELFSDPNAAEKEFKSKYIPPTSFSTTNFKGAGTDASPLEINNITTSNITDFEAAVQAQIQAYMAANPS